MKKIYRFIRATVVVILCLMLLGMTIELFLGEKRLYNYNHKYSTDERLTYLANHCKYYGFPRDNFEVLKSNDIVAKDFEHFPESDGCTLYLSTKHFDFKIPLYGGGEIEYIYDRVNKKNMVINYNGDYCYSNDINTDGPLVDKKTVKLMKKELNNKMDEIGQKLNYQIYNPF